MALIQYDGHPFKKREFRHPWRKASVKAEGGNDHLQAKEKGLEHVLPSRPSEGTDSAST